MLKSIISDKNKLFVSRYWQTLMQKINIKLKFSIAYYLQIDEQME